MAELPLRFEWGITNWADASDIDLHQSGNGAMKPAEFPLRALVNGFRKAMNQFVMKRV
jgi:hypothetical protein